MKYLKYNKTTWRKILLLANKLNKAIGPPACEKSYTRTIGNSEKLAKRYLKMLCWAIGIDASNGFEMEHPTTGHLRSIHFTPTGYADCMVSIYIDSE